MMNIETKIKLNKFQPRDGINNPAYKHGKAKTITYRIWTGMISRCYNINSKIYKYYGGRGIKVCDRWKDFINFYEDMGERPKNLQLDRINCDGNYEPNNCRWVSKQDNINNRRLIPDTMPNKKFGKWLVVERVLNYKIKTHWYYKCICECGTVKVIGGSELRRGKTTQCKKCKNLAHGIIHKNWSLRKKEGLNK